MKHLYFFRHGMAVSSYRSTADFYLPLTEQGIKDVEKVSAVIKLKKIKPDLILSSPAVRAYMSALVCSKFLSYPPEQIELIEKLYLPDIETLMNEVYALDDRLEHVMFFGHNPAFSEAVSLLNMEGKVTNMGTANVAGLAFDIQQWNQVLPSTGRLILKLSGS